LVSSFAAFATLGQPSARAFVHGIADFDGAIARLDQLRCGVTANAPHQVRLRGVAKTEDAVGPCDRELKGLV
jgi:hypothetical protein